MNCKKVKQNLIFLAEGSLQPEQAAAMHQHMAHCNKCNHVYTEMLQSLSVIEPDKQIKVDPWFSGRVEQQFISIQTAKNNRVIELKPVYRLLRIVPVAASLLIAIWLGILIGSELSPQFTSGSGSEEFSTEYQDDLVAEDIYAGTFEAFFLINGDK
jgi:predicted 2-oxoglutarate/Fe(II)-dependent dioxygenase YbiX